VLSEGVAIEIAIGGVCGLGRARSNAIALPNDRFASQQHARIVQVGRGFVLQDLGSRNGTFIERAESKWRVEGELPLQDGDVIGVGSARFVVQSRGGPAPAQPEERPGDVTFAPGTTVRGRVRPVPAPRPTDHPEP
jgi:pSer/pThr/pTyr-binding forkhead associated (FHA) protein